MVLFNPKTRYELWYIFYDHDFNRLKFAYVKDKPKDWSARTVHDLLETFPIIENPPYIPRLGEQVKFWFNEIYEGAIGKALQETFTDYEFYAVYIDVSHRLIKGKITTAVSVYLSIDKDMWKDIM